MERKRSSLLMLFVLLLAGEGLALLEEMSTSQRRVQKPQQLQVLTGGLGFGPAADLERCAFSFDPRLCPECAQNYGPIPAGAYFCPHHACSILYYPPARSAPAPAAD